jgi:hypothetical protein
MWYQCSRDIWTERNGGQKRPRSDGHSSNSLTEPVHSCRSALSDIRMAVMSEGNPENVLQANLRTLEPVMDKMRPTEIRTAVL